VIGGMCAGGILAYEIASQLRAVGHEVPLLILLDAFNPCYPRYRSFRDVLAHARYRADRARKIGVRNTFRLAYQGLARQLPKSLRRALAKSQVEKTQEIVESATLSYRPQRYAGPVLLLLASDCSPHKRTKQGWSGLVDGALTTLVVDGHHTELVQPPAVVQVAEAILSHLVIRVKPVESEESLTLESN